MQPATVSPSSPQRTPPMPDELVSLERKLQTSRRRTAPSAAHGRAWASWSARRRTNSTTSSPRSSTTPSSACGTKTKPRATKRSTKILAAAGRAEKITNGVLGLARNRGHERIPTDLAKLIDRRSCCWSARCRSIASRSSCNSSRRRPRSCAATRFSRCFESADQRPASHAARRTDPHPHRARPGRRHGRSHGARHRQRHSARSAAANLRPLLHAPSRAPTPAAKAAPASAWPIAAKSSKPIRARSASRAPSGVGTAFTLKLPVARAEAAPTAAAPAARHSCTSA